MDKFIRFAIDHKKRLACVVQAGQPDRYRKLRTYVGQLREWLKMQRAVHGCSWDPGSPIVTRIRDRRSGGAASRWYFNGATRS